MDMQNLPSNSLIAIYMGEANFFYILHQYPINFQIIPALSDRSAEFPLHTTVCPGFPRWRLPRGPTGNWKIINIFILNGKMEVRRIAVVFLGLKLSSA
jgi:hypothetical protein